MTELLAAGTELFGWVMTGFGDLIETIMSNPLLLMGFLMSLVGFVVGLAQRVMNLR